MIDSEPIRLLVYLTLALEASVSMSILYLVRDKPINWRRIPHVWLAIMALSLIAIWLAMLAVSIRDLHWLSRSDLIWPMLSLSSGTAILWGAWLILTVRVTFRIEHRRHGLNGNGAT
jgi:hypothetical protein